MVEIQVSKILPNRFNSRRIKADNTELKASIEKYGVLQKITVRKITDVKGFENEIVFGDERFRSLVELGRKIVDCEVKEYTNQESYVISLEENERRTDISPLEKSISYSIACGVSDEIIKAALDKLDNNSIKTYKKLDKPFSKSEFGKMIGISGSAVDNIIEPIMWSDTLSQLYDDGIPKTLIRELRIHTLDESDQSYIGEKLLEIINSGNHIDKKEFKKFLKMVDRSNHHFDELLHMIFDLDFRMIHITDKSFLKKCKAVCKVFKRNPDNLYTIDETISDAVSQDHDIDNEKVKIEDKKKQKQKAKIPTNDTSGDDDSETWGEGEDIPSNDVVDGKETPMDDAEEKRMVYVSSIFNYDTDLEQRIIDEFIDHIMNNYKSPMEFFKEYLKSKGIVVKKNTKKKGKK